MTFCSRGGSEAIAAQTRARVSSRSKAVSGCSGSDGTSACGREESVA
jgi:hypothetical protein